MNEYEKSPKCEMDSDSDNLIKVTFYSFWEKPQFVFFCHCVYSSRTLTKAQDPLTGAPPPPMTSSWVPLPLPQVMPLPHPPTCPHSPPLRRLGSRCTPCWTTPSPSCRPPLRAAQQGSLSQGSTPTHLAPALRPVGPDLGVPPIQVLALSLV